MTGVRISFVLASFNGAPYVEAQLRSILSVLTANDEIVVSDDGSTDNTLEIIRTIGDDRVQIVSSGERIGYQGNFQRAIAAARGRYIFFSDQDDICLPARLRASLDALSQYDCVCGDAIVVDQDLNELFPSYFAQRKAQFSAFQLFIRPSVIGATMACRRDFIIANMPFPRNVPHDMWLSLRAATRGRLAVVTGPFILYRRHESAHSTTGTSRRRTIRQIVSERARLLTALVSQWIREAI